jgi:hypothetical protein
MFYHKIIREHVNIFGNVFSNIFVKRENDVEILHEIKVPIAYSNKDSLYQMVLRRGQNPDNFEDNIKMTLPRIGFEIAAIIKDSQRKLNRINSYVHDIGSFNVEDVFTPVPYKIYFNLYIIANKQDDSDQILEQIIPLFTPDIKISSKYSLSDNFSLTIDESLCLLRETNFEDIGEQDFKSLQTRIITIPFSFDCSFFNIVNNKKLINNITSDFGILNDELVIESTSVYLDSANTVITENTMELFQYG